MLLMCRLFLYLQKKKVKVFYTSENRFFTSIYENVSVSNEKKLGTVATWCRRGKLNEIAFVYSHLQRCQVSPSMLFVLVLSLSQSIAQAF